MAREYVNTCVGCLAAASGARLRTGTPSLVTEPSKMARRPATRSCGCTIRWNQTSKDSVGIDPAELALHGAQVPHKQPADLGDDQQPVMLEAEQHGGMSGAQRRRDSACHYARAMHGCSVYRAPLSLWKRWMPPFSHAAAVRCASPVSATTRLGSMCCHSTVPSEVQARLCRRAVPSVVDLPSITRVPERDGSCRTMKH